MSSNVLDLIDNVVSEHELLSADAMRWAPDAPDPTPVHVESVRRACEAWALHMRVHVVPVMHEVFGAIAEAIKLIAADVSRAFPVRDVERRARLRRMHSDYHRRTRRRNRGR